LGEEKTPAKMLWDCTCSAYRLLDTRQCGFVKPEHLPVDIEETPPEGGGASLGIFDVSEGGGMVKKKNSWSATNSPMRLHQDIRERDHPAT
jgi:hypothetical protein